MSTDTERFDKIDTTLAEHGGRLDRIDATLSDHGQRFDKIDAALTIMAEAQAQTLSKLNRLLSLGWEAAKLRDDVDNALSRIARLERILAADDKP